MPVALGNVSNQIFDAVDPMVKNRQITAQLAIEKARIKAAKQAQLLNLGKDLFQQFSSQQNQRAQQERQIQAQQERDQFQAQQRQQEQAQSFLERQFIQNENQFNAMQQGAAKAGFGFNPDDQKAVDALTKRMKDIDLAVAQNRMTPGQAFAAKVQAQNERAVYQPNQQIITPAQRLNQNAIYEDENGNLFSKNEPGMADRQGTRVGFVGPDGKLIPTPKNTEAQQQAEHVLKMREEARKIADQAMQEGRDWKTTAEEIKKATGGLVDRTQEPQPANWLKGGTEKPAYTPLEVFKQKNDYIHDYANRKEQLAEQVRLTKITQSQMDQALKEEFGPRLEMIREQMDPNFLRSADPPTPEQQYQKTIQTLQAIHRDTQLVSQNPGVQSPAVRAASQRLKDFTYGPPPSDPTLAALKSDMRAIVNPNLPQSVRSESEGRVSQFRNAPSIQQSPYAPSQSSGISAPSGSSFVPGPQSNAPQQPAAPLMIGGEDATPFQRFVLQGGALDTGSIASNPVGQEYLREASGNIQEALQNFNDDKQALMQSLPIVPPGGQLPEGFDVGVDAGTGVVIGNKGSVENFATSTPKAPKRSGGGGGKPGGGMPKPPGAGQGAQKKPSELGSGRPQDKIQNPTGPKSSRRIPLDPDNPNPPEGLASRVLIFVEEGPERERIRQALRSMPAEQRQRIQIVTVDTTQPPSEFNPIDFANKHDVRTFPTMVKGEINPKTGRFNQTETIEGMDGISAKLTDARALRSLALSRDEHDTITLIEDRDENLGKMIKEFEEGVKKNGDPLSLIPDPYRPINDGASQYDRQYRKMQIEAYENWRNSAEAAESMGRARGIPNAARTAPPAATREDRPAPSGVDSTTPAPVRPKPTVTFSYDESPRSQAIRQQLYDAWDRNELSFNIKWQPSTQKGVSFEWTDWDGTPHTQVGFPGIQAISGNVLESTTPPNERGFLPQGPIQPARPGGKAIQSAPTPSSVPETRGMETRSAREERQAKQEARAEQLRQAEIARERGTSPADSEIANGTDAGRSRVVNPDDGPLTFNQFNGRLSEDRPVYSPGGGGFIAPRSLLNRWEEYRQYRNELAAQQSGNAFNWNPSERHTASVESQKPTALNDPKTLQQLKKYESDLAQKALTPNTRVSSLPGSLLGKGPQQAPAAPAQPTQLPIVTAYSTTPCAACDRAKSELAKTPNLPYQVDWKPQSQAPDWVQSFPSFSVTDKNGKEQRLEGWPGIDKFTKSIENATGVKKADVSKQNPQQPAAAPTGQEPVPIGERGLPQIKPPSLSEFINNSRGFLKTADTKDGPLRPLNQQELKQAYDNELKDIQNINDSRAGRPPSYPNRPIPNGLTVPKQSNIPNQRGIQPASATGPGNIAQRLAQGLTAPFRSAVAAGAGATPPSVNPRGPDSRAIQDIQRTERQQKAAQQSGQQARDAAMQQGFITPSAPGMNVNPSLRAPNPRGPTAPLRTGQMGQSQLPQILGELEKIKQQNNALDPRFTFPYLAGYGTGGTELARNRQTGVANPSGYSPVSSPFAYRAYGANQAQQQQFVQPFVYSPNNINSASSQSFGFGNYPQPQNGAMNFINPSNSGFSGPASQFNGYSPADYGFYSGEGFIDQGQYGGGFYEPPDNVGVIDSDYYNPGNFSDYDYYGGGYEGYDYGGGIDYGGYA